MKRRLTKDESKSAFESQVNRAAKAIRAISRIVESNPVHFAIETVEKAHRYLTVQACIAVGEMRSALATTGPNHAPFSLDAAYEPAETMTIKMGEIDARTGAIHSAPDIVLQMPAALPPTAPPPGVRRKAVGRLVGTRGAETVFAIAEPASRLTPEDPTEKPDKTGAIKNAGFIEAD